MFLLFVCWFFPVGPVDFFLNCFSFFLLKSTSSVQAGLFRVIANWVFKTPVDVFFRVYTIIQSNYCIYIEDYHRPLCKSLVNSQQIDMTFRVLNPLDSRLDSRGSPCLWSYTWNMTINSCFSWDVTDVTPFFFWQFWVCPIYLECFPPRKSIRWERLGAIVSIFPWGASWSYKK